MTIKEICKQYPKRYELITDTGDKYNYSLRYILIAMCNQLALSPSQAVFELNHHFSDSFIIKVIKEYQLRG